LIEEHYKVLKVMNDVTNRIDLDGFANMVGLNPEQTIERVKELANAGLVRKVGGGYGITDKGKAILTAIKPVSKDMVFHFYLEVNQPTGFAAAIPVAHGSPSTLNGRTSRKESSTQAD